MYKLSKILPEIKLINKVTPQMVTDLYYELDEKGYGDKMFEMMSQEELIKYLTPQGLIHLYTELMKLKNT